MAVTQWAVVGPGAVPGAPLATPGVVVNGASPGGPAPENPPAGRGYPRT